MNNMDRRKSKKPCWARDKANLESPNKAIGKRRASLTSIKVICCGKKVILCATVTFCIA